MLRPEEMTRVVVVGSISSLDATIECLYELGVLHLIDFTKQDEEFKIGQPLPKASDDSQKLLKLRSIIRALNIEERKPKEKMPVGDINRKIEQALVTLDLNTTSKTEARQKIQSLIREKESEITALSPFEDFGIPVEDYEGYDNILSLAGTCKSDPSQDLHAKTQQIEIFSQIRKSEIAIAVFFPNEDKNEIARILSEHDFQEVKLPKLKGDLKGIIATNTEQIKDLEADLKRVDDDIEHIRTQFADLIISTEEHLAIEVLKEETPLRIATTENSFVMDGWIPTSSVDAVQTALESRCCGLSFVETVSAEKEEEPPTKLKNPKPVQPFELFINLVSSPKYEEIDPTIMLFITFPLFFGFMIGDLGFGAGLTAAGALIRLKTKGSPDLRRLGTILFVGGLVASVFGLFLFSEAFGIPFHPPPQAPDEASWESVANMPISPLLEKMHSVNELLAISMVAGFTHLTIGLVFGFFNSVHHSRKHALAKIGWMLILLGLFEEIMTIAGDVTVTSEFINSTVFAFFPTASIAMVGMPVSIPALILILVGIVVLPMTEGPFALTEVLSIFVNLLSYARLAAIAIGKGGMALAFNTMLFPLIFDSGNVVVAILGMVLLVITQFFFVFLLGALSAGIQAIRLNYVEFFLKFFEGGGTEFAPLRYERKYSAAGK